MFDTSLRTNKQRTNRSYRKPESGRGHTHNRPQAGKDEEDGGKAIQGGVRKKMKAITMADIEAIPKDFLIPTDVAPFLRVAPYSINCQAQADPSKLGFPVIVMGTRVRIPKEGFIKFCRGEMQCTDM